jgi:hypothetical protein
MKQWLLSLLCQVRPHVWRKAKFSESPALKFCKRCGLSAAVKRRVKSVTTTTHADKTQYYPHNDTTKEPMA